MQRKVLYICIVCRIDNTIIGYDPAANHVWHNVAEIVHIRIYMYKYKYKYIYMLLICIAKILMLVSTKPLMHYEVVLHEKQNN